MEKLKDPLRDYYRSFASVSGALATVTGLGPIVSTWLPGAVSAYAFPPLGDAVVPARAGVVALAVVMTFLAFYSVRPMNIFRRLLSISFMAILFLLLYLLCFKHFVRNVPVPATNSQIFVSVGYERTPFAIRTFDGDSDWEMLRFRGTSDEEISKLWTASSVDVARSCLFLCYCGFLLSVVLIFSLGVRYQMPDS